MFFAYIGFDSVTTTAQETKNPQRTLPIGIIGSLVVSTALYIAVCAVMVGLVPYTSLNLAYPISAAMFVGNRTLTPMKAMMNICVSDVVLHMASGYRSSSIWVRSLV